MYSIQTVIYGIPITVAVAEKIIEMENDPNSGWFEDEHGVCGFTILYSGSADYIVGYCGVSLGELDECGDYVSYKDEGFLEYSGMNSIRRISLKPTQEQESQALQAIKLLPKELLPFCKPIGVYFVYSTS